MNKIKIAMQSFTIASILIAAQYVTSAVLTLNTGVNNLDNFYKTFNDTGYILVILSLVFFVIGFLNVVKHFSEK